MRFLAEWHDTAVNAAPEERVTVADLRLWLNGQNATMHLRGLESSDHLTMSLYGVAEGLAHHWWTLFGARDFELPLIAYRSGFAFPDIRLSFDGTIFRYAAEQKTYVNPDIRFWGANPESTTRTEAEAEIGKFIELVLDRLRDAGIAETSAALRWRRVRASRQDPEEAAFCEAAGALRLDPYNLDDTAAAVIEAAADLFEGECLTEFLAGATRVDRLSLVEWVREADRREPDTSLVGALADIVRDVDARITPTQTPAPWTLGYRRARALRRVMNLDGTVRFTRFGDIAKRVGAARRFALAAPTNGIRLLRTQHGGHIHFHMRAHGRKPGARESYLFTFARGIGDAVCFPTPQRSPLNELRSAYRQAAGRAFAAEFLAPVNEIRTMIDDRRDIVSIAQEFTVSTEVIERQIENADRIEAACSEPLFSDNNHAAMAG